MNAIPQAPVVSSGKIRVLCVENIAVEAAHRHIYRTMAAEKDFEIHLVTPYTWREAQNVVHCEPETEQRLHIHNSRIFFGFRQHRVLYRDLQNILANVQPHFIFLDQEPENFAAVQGVMNKKRMASMPKLALVSSRNINHLEEGFPYKYELAHRWCDLYLRKHPVDVCFVRTVAATPFMQAYGKSIVYLPFPVETERLHKVERKREDHSTFTIGYVGRLIEPKGVKLLLDILPSLPARVRMLFVGKGELAGELPRLARAKGVGDRVSVRPPVPHREIPTTFAEMDLVVVPSLDTKFWKEQCPRVPMEAMACEVPVIGSDSGGIPEVLGDAGLIFRQGNVADLREKIRDLLNNPELRRELARKGRARVVKEFDLSVIAKRLLETIAKTVK
jgi:glycosyltransferase involved in cell wall biosynthesis